MEVNCKYCTSTFVTASGYKNLIKKIKVIREGNLETQMKKPSFIKSCKLFLSRAVHFDADIFPT